MVRSWNRTLTPSIGSKCVFEQREDEWALPWMEHSSTLEYNRGLKAVTVIINAVKTLNTWTSMIGLRVMTDIQTVWMINWLLMYIESILAFLFKILANQGHLWYGGFGRRSLSAYYILIKGCPCAQYSICSFSQEKRQIRSKKQKRMKQQLNSSLLYLFIWYFMSNLIFIVLLPSKYPNMTLHQLVMNVTTYTTIYQPSKWTQNCCIPNKDLFWGASHASLFSLLNAM